MRISDWSSDVCSSDLPVERAVGLVEREARQGQMVGERSGGTGVLAEGGGEACLGDIPAQRLADLAVGIGEEIGRLAELGVEAGRGQREIGPLLGGDRKGVG